MHEFFLLAFVGIAAAGCLATPAISSSADTGGSAVMTGGSVGDGSAVTTGGGGRSSTVEPATGGSDTGGNGASSGATNSSGSGGEMMTSGGTNGGGVGGTMGRGGMDSVGGMASGGGMAGAATSATFTTLRVDDTCGSLLGGNVCLHAGKPSDNGTPFTKMASATMGGTAGMTYQVKIHVRGVVEPTHVQGGQVGTPAQFVTGGERYADGTNESTYQQWRLTTTVPNQHYFLNVYSQGLSHVVYVIDYMETIPIGGGSTVTLEVYDGNAHAISNTVNKPPLSIDGIPGSMMSGQFVQIDAM